MKYIKHRRKNTLSKTQLCFFCQRRFLRTELTREHVFGDWLIRDVDLERKTLTLFNGTKTKYSNLVVHACSKCNNVFGSQFENSVSKIVRNIKKYKGPLTENTPASSVISGFDNSVSGIITIWIYKIFLGILHFESSLPHAPRGTIIPSIRDLRKSHMFRHMRTSILKGEQIFLPSSFFVFELKESDEVESFDFFDSLDPMCVGIKVKNILFCLVLSDGQLTSNYLHSQGLKRLRNDIKQEKFGPLSYYMGYSQVLATRRNLPKNPSFMIMYNQIMNMSMMSLSKPRQINSKQVFEDASAIFRFHTTQRGYVFPD